MASGTVTATIQYAKWLDLYKEEKPFLLLCDIPKDAHDKRQSNIDFEDSLKDVQDVRGSKENFNVDDNGFMFLDHETKVTAFTDRKHVDETYLPEIEELLRQEVDGIDRIYFFDWRLRDSRTMESKAAANYGGVTTAILPDDSDSGEGEGEVFDLNDYTQVLYPATYCHVDQSPSAVLSRVQLQMGDDAAHLLRGRVRIFNIWRPLGNVVEDYPLAICDASTVSEDDFIEADHVRHGYVGATLYGMNRERHRWYYLSRQRPDEVLIMKMFDSDEGVTAKCCPHAAIKLQDVRPDAPTRKSIELRALVFTYAEHVK